MVEPFRHGNRESTQQTGHLAGPILHNDHAAHVIAEAGTRGRGVQLQHLEGSLCTKRSFDGDGRRRGECHSGRNRPFGHRRRLHGESRLTDRSHHLHFQALVTVARANDVVVASMTEQGACEGWRLLRPFINTPKRT